MGELRRKFYDSFINPVTLELDIAIEYLESRGYNIEETRERALNFVKQQHAQYKLKQGEKFIEKLNKVLSQIAENKINIKELNISPEAQDDLQFAFNKFEGNAEEFNKEKLKEQTTLELIRKIKEGEI
jgi:phage-related minor tail protein